MLITQFDLMDKVNFFSHFTPKNVFINAYSPYLLANLFQIHEREVYTAYSTDRISFS